MRFYWSIPDRIAFGVLNAVPFGMSYTAARESGLPWNIFGWFGVILFGAVLARLLVQLLRLRPVVTINHKGVNDRRMGVGWIVWDDIASVSVVGVKSGYVISLWLKNEDKYPRRRLLFKPHPHAIRKSWRASAYSMSFRDLSPELPEAYALLRKRLPLGPD